MIVMARTLLRCIKGTLCSRSSHFASPTAAGRRTLVVGILVLVCAGFRNFGFSIGALIMRIGFGGILSYIQIHQEPENSVGNFLGR